MDRLFSLLACLRAATGYARTWASGFESGVLIFRARTQRIDGPRVLGIAAACLILFGKFELDSSPAFYSGSALLILASVWNSCPFAMRCDCALRANSFPALGARSEDNL